jgi:predicted dehydrogenase
METINWGIIGCGDVTEIKSGPAFNKVANSKLVAVMRRDSLKAKDYARRHGVEVWYDDAQKLIDDPQVNAVYIATPPSSHEEYTILALKAGKPVYVEKPMTTDAASAQRMLQTSIDTDVKLSVAHYRREQPRFKKMKELIDANEIGDIRLVNLQCIEPPRSSSPTEFWRIDPAISGGGMFHDLAPHQLDIMQYFFGKHKQATGRSFNSSKLYAADDLVIGSIVFENGVVFNGNWCFTASPGEAKDLIEIIGSEGRISFSIFSSHHFTLSKNGREEVFTFEDLPHVQQPMIEAVVKYFLDQGSNPSTAENAVETMHIIDAFTGAKNN